jgi:hypothetical protein
VQVAQSTSFHDVDFDTKVPSFIDEWTSIKKRNNPMDFILGGVAEQVH